MASIIKPSHRGLLHRELGIPEGENISLGTLMREKEKAKRTGNGKMMKQVTFAENFGHGK
jgi:hypothetical protein